LAVEDLQGRFRGPVTRLHAGAADRHHKIHSPDHRGVQCVADLDLVGGDGHHAVDNEAGFGEQLGNQWPAVVLIAVRGPIVDNDDECPADQLDALFHGCNRISGVGPRRGDSHHCCALPKVTCTVLLSPDGSLNVSVTLSPGALDLTAATNASALLTVRSSTLVTTTLPGMPAAAAAPLGATSTTLAPGVSLSLVTCTPSEACDAVPELISSSAMRLA